MLDTLALATGLGGVALRLTRERLATPRPPSMAAVCTPAWLTEALAPRFPGVRVRDVRIVSSCEGTTDRANLALTYDAPGAPAAPPSLFVKLAPRSAATRAFGTLVGLGRTEVQFFRDIAPRLPVDLPAAYVARLEGPADHYVLVLEDLAARGATFRDVSDELALPDVERVIDAFAALHAALWEHPRLLGDLGWVRSYENTRVAAVERALCSLTVGRGAERFADVVPAPLRAAIPRLLAGRRHLEADWARGPRTLIHGDGHVGNLFFTAGGVGFLDWQMAQRGQSMRDVSYFLTNSTPVALRRAHERTLLDRYREGLAAHGVVAPAAEETWRRYRSHALYSWISCAVTAAAAGQLQADTIARTGLDRTSQAVVDLDALALLDG